MDTALPLAGLILLRASRLESLLEPLQALLRETRPDDVLAAQTVVAAHPGMKQWLTGALARQAGRGGIVANLDVMLPSAWLDALSVQLLGERAVALPHYRRAHLRWTLHALLAEPAQHGIDEPRVLAYLQGGASADERALRHFQLADRLARVLSQYLVYRADWLAAWEAGKDAFATARLDEPALRALESRCLAPLWRAAARQLGPHRGRLVQELVAALDVPDAALPPLHLFGLSHLPPAELAALRAYARRAPVFLYVPDPCREYWGGLYAPRDQAGWRQPDPAPWQAFREQQQQQLDDPTALDWHDQGHPLLARWGRLGQHFFAALVEGDVREDIRHGQDEDDIPPQNRLQRLQESIRRLQPALLAEAVADPAARQDASLRIHACHTRLRELEVLRDALLDAIAHEDGLTPGDIVVMAPDIRAYLPLIPAVFGEPGSARERLLPYHLADVPVARSHRLFEVFATLLGIGGARITAPEVVDLLAVPELRRALALDEADADILIEWLRASRVAWALDGAHKAGMNLPARSEYSFAWAMDRMLAGYLMADVADAQSAQTVILPDATELLPLGGIDGPASAALGALDRLLRELQAWRALAEAEQPASAWADQLRTRVDALLRVDPGDRPAREALAAIHRAIASLAGEPARNDEDPALRLAVVREWLDGTLAAEPERQRFLMGGITFCGMVPQRAIPFAMVCVLGLDEGAFPRNPPDGGLDLMARLRRVGDRDVPGDDRYLFLETLMSARRRLHLSFIGQGVRDGKPRNPAAPLAELVAELEHQCGIAPGDDQAPRPWWVRHPLQPFDVRYFDGSHPALYSYSAAFAGMCGAGRQPLPGLRAGKPLAPEPFPEPLPLALLEGYFRDPAKALLKDHLQLALDALDDDARLPEEEPLAGLSPQHAVARRVFFEQVLPATCADPDGVWDGQPPGWVAQGGLLPLGEAGRQAWEQQADAVRALRDVALASGRFVMPDPQGGRPRPEPVDVALPAADDAPALRIVGILREVFPLRDAPDGVHLVFAWPAPGKKPPLKKPEDLGFKEQVPAFLHWALLRLQRAASPAPVRLTMLAAGEPDMARRINAWDASFCAADAARRAALTADLYRRLRELVALWQKGRDGLSCFYPQSGWSAVQAEQAGKDVAKAAATSWVRDFGDNPGERDYAPGYAHLLEGELVFGRPDSDPDRHALDALLQDARQLDALLRLDAEDDASPAAEDAA